MYSTCLFCHYDLGANEVVEHFPVGRRLAFDGEKGRLWVVCRKCERWNLTPIEERWEAIEECERLFRGTKLRMSSEHIGLARVREGLELVRVGNPQRPEMAAWRYGDQFGKRRRRYYMVAGGSVLAVAAFASGFVAFGAFTGGASALLNAASATFGQVRNRKVVARVPTPEGVFDITRSQLPEAKIVRSSASGWQLSVKCVERATGKSYRWWQYQPRSFTSHKRIVNLEPHDALPALAALLPTVNGRGGTRRSVQSAVDLIEESGSTTQLLNAAASLAMKTGWNATMQGRLSTIPIEARLALEMVTHEEDERRALEGELATLEERWKEAEEIAGISDDMFMPASVTEWIQKMRS